MWCQRMQAGRQAGRQQEMDRRYREKHKQEKKGGRTIVSIITEHVLVVHLEVQCAAHDLPFVGGDRLVKQHAALVPLNIGR